MEKNGDKNGVRPQNKNLKPFKKGENGGAHRPLGQRNYATIYKEALIKLAELNETTPESLENEILSKGITLARKGDFRFYKDLLDRLHGQAELNLNIQGQKEVAKKLDEILKDNEETEEGS